MSAKVRKYMLYVEGNDDKHVIHHLLAKHQLEWDLDSITEAVVRNMTNFANHREMG